METAARRSCEVNANVRSRSQNQIRQLVPHRSKSIRSIRLPLDLTSTRTTSVFLPLLTGWLLAGTCVAAEKPNIVFLFIDDWAWNGCNRSRLGAVHVKIDLDLTAAFGSQCSDEQRPQTELAGSCSQRGLHPRHLLPAGRLPPLRWRSPTTS